MNKWDWWLCVLRSSSVVSPPCLLSCDVYGWATFSNISYAFHSLLLLCILLLPFLCTLRIKASVSSECVRRLLCVFSFHVFVICSVWKVIFRIFHPAAIVSCLHITLHSIYYIWAKVQLLNSFPPFNSFQLFSISCRYRPMHFFLYFIVWFYYKYIRLAHLSAFTLFGFLILGVLLTMPCPLSLCTLVPEYLRPDTVTITSLLSEWTKKSKALLH